MEIRINSFIPITNVEGPGTRFCIWVQGCSIHCKGCANSHMWDKSGGKIYQADEILKIIKSYSGKIEGITFLGGEPLEQIEAVNYISKEVQKLNLSVVVFTGYEYEEINNNPEIQELTNNIDILIDGKYEQDKQDFSRAWVGSSNQKYHFFSDRYSPETIKKYRNKIEVRINNGKVVLTGMGNFSELAKAI